MNQLVAIALLGGVFVAVCVAGRRMARATPPARHRMRWQFPPAWHPPVSLN